MIIALINNLIITLFYNYCENKNLSPLLIIHNVSFIVMLFFISFCYHFLLFILFITYCTFL